MQKKPMEKKKSGTQNFKKNFGVVVYSTNGESSLDESNISTYTWGKIKSISSKDRLRT
jgi:hypothetical protein